MVPRRARTNAHRQQINLPHPIQAHTRRTGLQAHTRRTGLQARFPSARSVTCTPPTSDPTGSPPHSPQACSHACRSS